MRIGVVGFRVRGKAFLTCDDVCCRSTQDAVQKGISVVKLRSVPDAVLASGGDRVV